MSWVIIKKKSRFSQKVKIVAKSHVTLHQKTVKMAELCVRVSSHFDRTQNRKEKKLENAIQKIT